MGLITEVVLSQRWSLYRCSPTIEVVLIVCPSVNPPLVLIHVNVSCHQSDASTFGEQHVFVSTRDCSSVIAKTLCPLKFDHFQVLQC